MHNILPGLSGLAQPIEGILEDPANARKHDDTSIRAIARSLEQFGQRKPIIVRQDNNTVVAGNGTLCAARSLGWDSIAVLMVDDDKGTAIAYALADNKTAELSNWDDDALREALAYLSDEYDHVMEATAFSVEELDELLRQTASRAPQDATSPSPGHGEPMHQTKPEEVSSAFSYALQVQCTGELDQKKLLARLEGEGLQCKPLIW